MFWFSLTSFQARLDLRKKTSQSNIFRGVVGASQHSNIIRELQNRYAHLLINLSAEVGTQYLIHWPINGTVKEIRQEISLSNYGTECETGDTSLNIGTLAPVDQYYPSEEH